MKREEAKPYVVESLIKLGREIGLDMNDWTINLSEVEGEGHGYLLPDESYYEEWSYVYLVNKRGKDILHLWIDVGFVEGMSKPIYFIENISSENKVKLSEYGIKINPNPEEYLKANLSLEQYEELMKQLYFSERRHMRLYDARKDRTS